MVTTGRPTPEFRRQHDVEAPRVDERAFRQGWIVRTRLDQLLADKRITRGEYQAACDYRTAWGTSRELRRVNVPLGMIRFAASSTPDEGLVRKFDAEAKLVAVEAAIGALATGLVVACVIEDLSWAATARFCHRNPETVRDWTVVALRALARAWGSRQDAPGRKPSKDSRQRVTAL